MQLTLKPPNTGAHARRASLRAREPDRAAGGRRVERLVVRHTCLAPGPKRPDAETACDNRRDPRRPHWNLEAAEMDGHLLERAHDLPEGDEAEDRA